MRTFVGLVSLASVVTAHFTLDWPVARGTDEDNMPNFPCGGFDTPSSNRTVIALGEGSIPVDITFHHSQTVVSYLLALGSDPSTNFNITLGPTLAATGLGEFCLPKITLESAVIGVDLTDGLNATLQVVTDGDSGGGLYACADITFSSSITTNNPAQCANNTAVAAKALSGADGTRVANTSQADGSAQSTSSNPTTTGAAVSVHAFSWSVFGIIFAGCLAVI